MIHPACHLLFNVQSTLPQYIVQNPNRNGTRGKEVGQLVVLATRSLGLELADGYNDTAVYNIRPPYSTAHWFSKMRKNARLYSLAPARPSRSRIHPSHHTILFSLLPSPPIVVFRHRSRIRHGALQISIHKVQRKRQSDLEAKHSEEH